jgi:hypothetical protein
MAVDDLDVEVKRESDFDSNNPAAADSLHGDPVTSAAGLDSLEGARSDLESALNGLQEGNVTAEATVDTLMGLIDARIAQRAELEKQTTSGGQLESAVKSMFAHLTEAPCNWHQAVTFFLCSQAEEDAALRQKAPLMFVAGSLMVFMQIAAAISVWGGSYKPSCVDNDQCQVAQGAPSKLAAWSFVENLTYTPQFMCELCSGFQYGENSKNTHLFGAPGTGHFL